MPRQKRARITVDSILQATGELIQNEGFASISTGRIAERAGVSIASLYQYYPNRDTILLSLYERAAADGARKFNTLVMSKLHESLEVVTPKILKLLLSLYEQNALILITMVNEVPEIRRANSIVTFEKMIRSTLWMYLQQHPEYRVKDVSRHMFLIERIGIDSLRHFVMEAPPHVSKAEFLASLSRIIVTYLKSEFA